MHPIETANQTRFEPFVSGSYVVRMAVSHEDRMAIYRLRYEVFAIEAGNPQLFRSSSLEFDAFDDYCEHLMVEDLSTGQLAGTYRVLPGSQTIYTNGFYSETEFDFYATDWKLEHVYELGRSCVAKTYRNGTVIRLLWDGLYQYLTQTGAKWLIGCASMPVPELQELNELVGWLQSKAIFKNRFGIKPHATNRIFQLKPSEFPFGDREMLRKLPPLIRGYISLGATIEAEPAYDPIFDTVDFLIVLDLQQFSVRHASRMQKG